MEGLGIRVIFNLKLALKVHLPAVGLPYYLDTQTKELEDTKYKEILLP
jgi:hypothetical protein